MLVIKRKVSQKGNSLYVSIPKKELNGSEVVVMDLEAYEGLIAKNG